MELLPSFWPHRAIALGAFVWFGKRGSLTRRPLLPLNAGTAEPVRVSPPEAVAYLLELQCVSCKGYFYETDGTIFHGKRSSPELIVHVIACLAEGLGIRGTARVFEMDANTVLHWLMEAAEQL